jgi:hypothetical protein
MNPYAKILVFGAMNLPFGVLFLFPFLLLLPGCKSCDTSFSENSSFGLNEEVDVPDLDSLKECPYGHSNLKRISILYGFPIASEELTRKLENKEIVLGGCCGGPAEDVIECLECGFSIQEGFDPSFASWTRSSEDPDSFERKISELLINLKPLGAER